MRFEEQLSVLAILKPPAPMVFTLSFIKDFGTCVVKKYLKKSFRLSILVLFLRDGMTLLWFLFQKLMTLNLLLNSGQSPSAMLFIRYCPSFWLLV
jgi:hypothetical protein